MLTLAHTLSRAPDRQAPCVDGDAGLGGGALHAWWAAGAASSRSVLQLADGTPSSAAGLVAAPTQSMYCTQRLRERTFPFASAPLNIVYLFAMLTRLIFVSVAMRVRRNFGRGLSLVLHGRRSDSSRAAGSGFSSGVHDPVLGPDSSAGSVAAAAEYLLPRPVADDGSGPSSGLLPLAAEHRDILSGIGQVKSAAPVPLTRKILAFPSQAPERGTGRGANSGPDPAARVVGLGGGRAGGGRRGGGPGVQRRPTGVRARARGAGSQPSRAAACLVHCLLL